MAFQMVTVKMFFLFFCTIVLISLDSPLAHIMMLPIDYDSTYTRKSLPVGIYIGCGAFLHYHFWYSGEGISSCACICCTLLYIIVFHYFNLPLRLATFLMLFVDSRNNYRCLIHLFILFLFSFVLQSRLQSSTWNHSCHCF